MTVISVLTTIVVSLAAIFLLVKFLKRKAVNFWVKLGVQYVELEGVILKLLIGKFNPVGPDLEAYGKIKKQRFGGLVQFNIPILYITDLDLMKQVYIKDFDYFVDRRTIDTKKNDPHFALALINQKGEAWKELRSKMSPTFTTGKIRRMFSIFDSSSKKMVKAVRTQAEIDANIELRPFIQKLTMDIIASAAFGIQTDLFEEPDSYFAKMGQRMQNQLSGLNLFKILLIITMPKIAELLKITFIDSKADAFFSKMVTNALNHRQETGIKRDDFLQILLEARQGQLKLDESELNAFEKDAQLKDVSSKAKVELTDDVIIAQSLLFILGGFDTVETVLSFIVYELGVNPDIQVKLLEEITVALEKNDGECSYDLINSLEYLDMVVSETLRKYPPAVRGERKSTRPYKIPGTDVVLPEGTLVGFPVYAIQHDPEYWPDPDKFDPERFRKENVAKRHPMTYQPFGHGPRNCIGMRFALVEMKVALVQLIQNFKWEPNQQTKIPIEFGINGGVLKPKDNLPFSVRSTN